MLNIFKPKWVRAYEKANEIRDKKSIFKRELEDMVHDAWDSGGLQEGKLMVCDRYILEFESLIMTYTSLLSPLVHFIVYDEELNEVYILGKRVHYFLCNEDSRAGQRRLELEYWLSLDWKEDE